MSMIHNFLGLVTQGNTILQLAIHERCERRERKIQKEEPTKLKNEETRRSKDCETRFPRITSITVIFEQIDICSERTLKILNSIIEFVILRLQFVLLCVLLRFFFQWILRNCENHGDNFCAF